MIPTRFHISKLICPVLDHRGQMWPIPKVTELEEMEYSGQAARLLQKQRRSHTATHLLTLRDILKSTTAPRMLLMTSLFKDAANLNIFF